MVLRLQQHVARSVAARFQRLPGGFYEAVGSHKDASHFFVLRSSMIFSFPLFFVIAPTALVYWIDRVRGRQQSEIKD